jgi:RND family efflux transporter MFP subunit
MIAHLERLTRHCTLLVHVLVLGSCGCGAAADSEEAKPPAPVEMQKASLDQTIPEWTELIGTTQPLPGKVARITTAVEAQVRWVLAEKGDGTGFKEGQWVKEGDIIARLDDRVFQANVARGQAGLDKLNNTKLQADLDVKVADVEVRRLAKLKMDRVTVADSEVEKASLAVETAKLKVKSVLEDLKVAQAELNALKTQEAFYTLKAPITGQLGRVEVVTGQTLAIGTRVAEIINLKSHIDVLCFVPPANIDKVPLEHDAVLVLDDLKNDLEKTHVPVGKVVFKDDQAQPDTGNFAVKVRFPNDMLKLPANAVVRVRVLTRTKQHCITVPEEAVLDDQDPPVVVLVMDTKEEGEKEPTPKAYRYPVKLGIRDRDKKRIEILELDPDHSKGKAPAISETRFVTVGGHGLQDKDPVKVEKPKETEK